MGCNSSVSGSEFSKKAPTAVGHLDIELVKLQINEKHPLFKGQQIQFKLSISNQQFFCSKNQYQINKNNKQKTVFKCFINSLYKHFGRMLIIDLWSNQMLQKFSSQTRAIGILDLNGFIQNKNKENTARCYLNFQKHNIGHIDLKIMFRKLSYVNFDFQIHRLYIENGEIINGDPFCRVYAGEQILQTHLPKANDRNQIEKLKKQTLQFCIPKGLQQITIQVLQKTQRQPVSIGQASINLNHIDNFQVGKPFKISLFQDQKNLGYVEVQIFQIKSGKSLQQIISEGTFSMKNINIKSDKDIITQPSTNFLKTQKKMGTFQSIELKQNQFNTEKKTKQFYSSQNQSVKTTSIKVIEQGKQNIEDSSRPLARQQQNQIRLVSQKRVILPPLNSKNTKNQLKTSKKLFTQQQQQKQGASTLKDLIKDIKIPCLTIGQQ